MIHPSLRIPRNSAGGRPHSIRDRLWLAGLGTLLFLVTLVIVSHLAGPAVSLLHASAGGRGADLMPSYMAGCFVREGRPDKLMSLREAVRFQAHFRRVYGLTQTGRTGPWLNPPFFAWVFVPLTFLSYPAAQWVWLACNVLMLSTGLILLCRMLIAPGADSLEWRTWGLVLLLILTSMPFLQAFASQQNTFLSLLLVCACVTLWRRGHAVRAGLVCGLLLFKPQLAAVLALALSVSLGWRAMLGVILTGASLLTVTAYGMPGALTDYVHQMPSLLPWLEPGHSYAWSRQVTFQGFWRMVFQGPVSGPAPLAVKVLWPMCATIYAAILIPAFLGIARARRSGAAVPPDRLIAATMIATPLLMPYYMDYDLLLLAVPAVLWAAERLRRANSMQRSNRILLGAWCLLLPWLYVNAAFADVSRISVTVPILCFIGGVYAYRAAKQARELNVELRKMTSDLIASIPTSELLAA